MRTIFILLFIGLAAPLMAQSITFTYDNSGNRIGRELTGSGTREEDAPADTLQQISEELAEAFSTVYPNATNGKFTVQLADPSDHGKLFIFDVKGRLIYQQDIPGSLDVDISKQPEGVYLIKCRTTRELITRKIIKNQEP